MILNRKTNIMTILQTAKKLPPDCLCTTKDSTIVETYKNQVCANTIIKTTREFLRTFWAVFAEFNASKSLLSLGRGVWASLFSTPRSHKSYSLAIVIHSSYSASVSLMSVEDIDCRDDAGVKRSPLLEVTPVVSRVGLTLTGDLSKFSFGCWAVKFPEIGTKL